MIKVDNLKHFMFDDKMMFPLKHIKLKLNNNYLDINNWGDTTFYSKEVTILFIKKRKRAFDNFIHVDYIVIEKFVGMIPTLRDLFIILRDIICKIYNDRYKDQKNSIGNIDKNRIMGSWELCGFHNINVMKFIEV